MYLFPQLSYALALFAFHSFVLVGGRNAPADVLLHCDWLIQSCFGKLCPTLPPRPPLLFICAPPSSSSVLSLSRLPLLSSLLSVKGNFWFVCESAGGMILAPVRLFIPLKRKRYGSACGRVRRPQWVKITQQHFYEHKCMSGHSLYFFSLTVAVCLLLLCDADGVSEAAVGQRIMWSLKGRRCGNHNRSCC